MNTFGKNTQQKIQKFFTDEIHRNIYVFDKPEKDRPSKIETTHLPKLSIKESIRKNMFR